MRTPYTHLSFREPLSARLKMNSCVAGISSELRISAGDLKRNQIVAFGIV
jgi:hypothetical protein